MFDRSICVVLRPFHDIILTYFDYRYVFQARYSFASNLHSITG